MENLTLGQRGELTLPESVRNRYGFRPDATIRLIETRSGVLLVPLTTDPMSEELARELGEWQSFGSESWAEFDYEETEP